MKKGSSGGSAMQRGAEHQNRVAARFLAHLLAEEPFLYPGDAVGNRVLWVRCETGEAIDDIHVKVETPIGDAGFIWIQCKTRVDLASSDGSPFVDTLRQFVDQYDRSFCPPIPSEEWERPLDYDRDAFVLAVETGSESVVSHLSSVLVRLRHSQSGTPAGSANRWI